MKALNNTRFILLATALSIACNSPLLAEPRSGYDFIKPETRALQDDDFENPGLLTVDEGNELFNTPLPEANKSCADCHQQDGEGLDTKSIARYPVVDRSTQTIVTLQDRIIGCTAQSGSKALAPDDRNLVALETFVRHLAKGESVAVNTEGLDDLLARGEKLFSTRYGLIDMACQHCHVLYPDTMIRGQHISEGMANGFPVYRLDIGEITTTQQRVQQCLNLMRAEPFESGSEELRVFELYMMARSNGLAIETPAVRY